MAFEGEPSVPRCRATGEAERENLIKVACGVAQVESSNSARAVAVNPEIVGRL